jgi:hypothetical protein
VREFDVRRNASRKSVASRSADTVDGIASSSPSSSSPLDDDDDDDDDDDTARVLTPTLAPSTSPRARRGDERMRCPIDRSRTTTRERRADDARMPRRRRRRARTLDERLEFHSRAIGREEDDARRRETRERVTNANHSFVNGSVGNGWDGDAPRREGRDDEIN